MKEYLSHSADETYSVGRQTAELYGRGTVFALFGGLGMGKTAFTKGLAAGYGINADVTSPTFSLVNEYFGENTVFYHFDMYRISSWDDLYSTGFFDYLGTDAVLSVEWSENIENALPDECICVSLNKGKEENERYIKIGSREEIRS